MIYAITYKDYKGNRQVMFDRDQALIVNGADLANQKFVEAKDRIANLLDGSPVQKKIGLFKSELVRTEYPLEKIAFWRQCLQTLEIVPHFIKFEGKK